MRLIKVLLFIILALAFCQSFPIGRISQDGKTTESNLDLLQSRPRRSVSLYGWRDRPKHFHGKLTDIPQRVLMSKPGTIVTTNGVEHTWRKKRSMMSCFRSCLREQLISCKIYYYDASSKKCIMIEMDYEIKIEHPIPRHFHGRLMDFPHPVTLSKPGTLVAHYGIGYIWRYKRSLMTCYKACRRQKRLTCNIYYYNTASRKCIMIMMDYDFPQLSTTPMTTSTSGPLKIKLDFENNMVTSVLTKSSRRRKKRSTDSEELKETPNVFSGKHSDISERVENSPSGTVVTAHGIPHLWRPRSSGENCYEACLYEKVIDCNFYFYNAFNRKCIMMWSDYGLSLSPFTLTQIDVDKEELELNNEENIHASVNGNFPHSRSKRILEELDSSPTKFPGKLSDIPEEVLESDYGSVVTIGNVKQLWRPRGSLKACSQACEYEQIIECVSYYYDVTGGKCIMFTKPSQKILEEHDSSPTKFPGKLSDIPEEVLESDYGSVVTIGNIKQLWRPRGSWNTCSQACEYEHVINCVSYYYDVTGGKCIMFTKPSQKSKTETKPSSEVQESKTSSEMQNENILSEVQESITSSEMQNENILSEVQESITSSEMQNENILSEVQKAKTSSEMQNENILSEVQKAKTSSKKEERKTLSEKQAEKIRNANVQYLKHVILKIEALVDSKMKLLNKDKNSDNNLLHDLRNDQVAVQKSINHLTDNVKQLRKVNPYLIKKINGMNGAQNAIAGELKNFGIFEKKMANVLADINKKVSDLDGDMSSVKETNEKLQRQMKGEEFANPQFNKNIVQLRRAIMDLNSKIEINPTTIKIRKNQQILAKALESIDNEIILNERRLGHIDLSNSDWAARLVAEEQHRKTINDVIQSLIKSLKDLRNDVRRLENPESSENAERTKEIRQMRSDIEILEKSNAKLEQDLVFARTDMTHLVKDLLNIQVSSQDRKINVLALVESNKNLAFDAKQQKADQNQMLTKIQTLATVYRNVLSTLHTLEMKQIQVMHKLRKHENDMQHMSSDFLEHSIGFGTSFKNKKMMSQSLQYMFLMKNFQTKLAKQINQLRRELFKIKQRYNKIMFGVEPKKEESLSQRKTYPQVQISKLFKKLQGLEVPQRMHHESHQGVTKLYGGKNPAPALQRKKIMKQKGDTEYETFEHAPDDKKNI